MTHTKQDNMRKTVIGAPLLLTLVFCFGFFMAHPASSGIARSASMTSDSNRKASAARSPVNKLSPLQPTNTTLQPLDQAQPSNSSSMGSAASPQSYNTISNPQLSASQRTGNTSSAIKNPLSGNATQSSSSQLDAGGILQGTLNKVLKIY